jgi:polyhydroxybutyrate depolymerase
MKKLLFITLIFLYSNFIYAQYSSIEHNNETRQYIYYEPENLQKNAPLVFVMHGYSSDASVIKNYSNMNTIANENGFAVCYPRGTEDDYGNRFWNVGYDFHPDETVDDVDFLVQLVDYLQNKHDLSNENIFATGMSNGGEMCYMLACEASTTFKAVTSVAGMMLQDIMDSCNSENLIPIFEIHGTNDDVNIYNGDPNSSGEWGAYPSIPETIDYWSNLNNCSSFTTENLPNPNSNDGSYVVKERHYDSDNGNEIWLYKVVGGGHDWPGAFGNMDINSSLEAWLFFKLTMNNLLLSTNDEFNNKIKLFPNPTTSEVALNSDKEYNIDVYDILGNKVMELSGNTIDFSHLSKATYIVKAFDKIDQEYLSYKVIKH